MDSGSGCWTLRRPDGSAAQATRRRAARWRRLALVCALLATAPAPGAAQTPVYRAGWESAAAAVGAGALSLLPHALGLPRGRPACAPCDPASLPGIDRWVVGRNSRAAGTGSDLLLLGVAGGSLLASVNGVSATRARGDGAVLLNAVGWTALSTEWINALIHRNRPVLYSDGAVAASGERGSRESLPSGHTSIAFAAATAYAVMARRQHLPHATRNNVLLFAGATGVGALRVTAGRHFLTDVIAGAALGAGVGWLTARLHPTSP